MGKTILTTWKKRRRLMFTITSLGSRAACSLVNVASDEKLSKVIGQDPMFSDSEREIYPLTTRQTHEKQIRELLQPEEAGF